MQDQLVQYRPILQRYHLQTSRIDDYGNVKKVYTNAGIFALKEIKDLKYIRAVEQAYFFYGQQMIPLYVARDGAPFVASSGRYYYLMPWILSEEQRTKREDNLSFFRDLASLHQKTVREVDVNEDDVRKYYEARKQEWEKQRSFLQSYAEQCEREWYMSPFQLQFCTYFHELMQAYWFAETQLERWYEKVKETKKWRIAFVHGKAVPSHYVRNGEEKGYFCSWERAYWASPLVDILTCFHDYVRTAPPIGEEWIEGMLEYERQLVVREEERAFFLSHAASPSHVYRFVSRYVTDEGKDMHEYDGVVRLQREYWVVKHTEYIVTRLLQKAEQSSNPLEVESDGDEHKNSQ
ncbi:spore coat protein YsxE [Anoxybacteroides tepidamans]|uniref:spore coat protein YsxE n=1 Tax=Anoxybacteroides tepidamans TaxID=265948 RepID=UPI00048A3CB2|nr:spore coat protein YsxE [Anoxybacillus tepidamans]